MGVQKRNLKLEQVIDPSYDIVYGQGLFPQIIEDIQLRFPKYKLIIVTDDNLVETDWVTSFEELLASVNIGFYRYSITPGEDSKTIDTVRDIQRHMFDKRFDGRTLLVSLGGGVVEDISGLVASEFQRGIPYIKVPTTLMAQSDSSIGGKPVVNLPPYKNQIGNFYQPVAVYIDPSILGTLPMKKFQSGLAEIIKHAIIADPEYFKILSERMAELLDKSKNYDLITDILIRSFDVKGRIVETDLFDKGPRRVLNYGHTVGHALEALSDYELSHGETVSIGMMVAGRISNLLGYFSDKDLQAQEQLLEAAGLPTKIPENIENQRIIEVTSTDKKAREGKARYVLPSGIGSMCEFDGAYATYVEKDLVDQALNLTR